MEKLVMVIAPVNDNDGKSLATERAHWARILASKHGGMTILPDASGVWIPGFAKPTCTEDVQVWYIYDETFDASCWKLVKSSLEHDWRQADVFILVLDCTRV